VDKNVPISTTDAYYDLTLCWLYVAFFVLKRSVQPRVRTHLCCDTGTPFQFLVTDMNKAGARGEGLATVRSGQVATFYVTAPAAQLKDINVSICGTCIILILFYFLSILL